MRTPPRTYVWVEHSDRYDGAKTKVGHTRYLVANHALHELNERFRVNGTRLPIHSTDDDSVATDKRNRKTQPSDATRNKRTCQDSGQQR